MNEQDKAYAIKIGDSLTFVHNGAMDAFDSNTADTLREALGILLLVRMMKLCRSQYRASSYQAIAGFLDYSSESLSHLVEISGLPIPPPEEDPVFLDSSIEEILSQTRQARIFENLLAADGDYQDYVARSIS